MLPWLPLLQCLRRLPAVFAIVVVADVVCVGQQQFLPFTHIPQVAWCCCSSCWAAAVPAVLSVPAGRLDAEAAWLHPFVR